MQEFIIEDQDAPPMATYYLRCATCYYSLVERDGPTIQAVYKRHGTIQNWFEEVWRVGTRVTKSDPLLGTSVWKMDAMLRTLLGVGLAVSGLILSCVEVERADDAGRERMRAKLGMSKETFNHFYLESDGFRYESEAILALCHAAEWERIKRHGPQEGDEARAVAYVQRIIGTQNAA